LYYLTQHVRGKIFAQITKTFAAFAILRTSKDDIKFFKICFCQKFSTISQKRFTIEQNRNFKTHFNCMNLAIQLV